ncbi:MULTISPECIES: hypothetical protein [Microcoleaceae]|uniref:hypothetical protein n=1 Tax=Microcoleaceae TaxID=1892252 RepID=UPI00187E57E6|nr:hypothetical protein [Tychonema sp. LEGE 06208]MBE9161382.1 hypothetical protein [Tychonema sp. LEGE 06208]
MGEREAEGLGGAKRRDWASAKRRDWAERSGGIGNWASAKRRDWELGISFDRK